MYIVCNLKDPDLYFYFGSDPDPYKSDPDPKHCPQHKEKMQNK